MKRLLPLLFLPALAWAEPFAGVTDARDVADGVAVTAVSSSAAFAPVTDPRDTMPMAPPPAVAAAPVDDRIAETSAIIVPHPVTPTISSPTLPPLVKRGIPQKVTEAAPGLLLVQPDDISAKAAEPPLRTDGTISGQMFNDLTETLTPAGIVEDQPEPKDGFSFGSGHATPLAVGPAENAPPLSAAPLPQIPVTTEISPTTSAATVAGPVKIISPLGVVTPSQVVAVPVTSTTVSETQASTPAPLTQPIAAALTFMADDITLSVRLKQQLQTFGNLAKGNVLTRLTLTQRTAAPLNALGELAGARRKAVLDTLKAEGIIGEQTRISEVRVRGSGANSKITLIGQ